MQLVCRAFAKTGSNFLVEHNVLHLAGKFLNMKCGAVLRNVGGIEQNKNKIFDNNAKYYYWSQVWARVVCKL